MRQLIVFLCFFSECVACSVLTSVGAVLKTVLLKAVCALATKSNIANLASVTVDLDLQRLTLGHQRDEAGVQSLVSSLLITKLFHSLVFVEHQLLATVVPMS